MISRQSRLGIFEVLFQYRGTLLQLSGAQQLVHLPVHRNQRARIVVTAIDQHHANAQFAEHVLVKRVQPLVAVKANQQTVKMQIVADGSRPIPLAHRQVRIARQRTRSSSRSSGSGWRAASTAGNSSIRRNW